MAGDIAALAWMKGGLVYIYAAQPQQTPSLVSTVRIPNCQANTLLVLTFADSDDGTQTSAAPTITSVPSLTWTKQVESRQVSSGNTGIWTAPFTAGGDIAVTTTKPDGGTVFSVVLYSMQNTETTLGGTSNFANDQGAPSVTVTSTRTNSILFCVSSNWGNSVGGKAYRDSAIEVFTESVALKYTAYHYYKPAVTVQSYTEGLSSPTGGDYGTSVLEIRGNL